MKKLSKKMAIILLGIISLFFLNNKVEAASIGMSISKSSGYVGDSFTVTISGINGRVNISGNSNVSLNITGSQWVDGSLTITGTAKSIGTGTITVTPVNVSTTSATPEKVTASASKSITIKEKEATPTQNQQTQTQQTTKPQTTKPTTNNTNKKPTTTTTKPKEETTVQQEVPKEEEESHKLGVYYLYIEGIKENEEKEEIKLDKEFNYDTYEYNCTVSKDIKKLAIQKEAYEYNDLVQITGTDELKYGENIVTIKVAKDEQNITYTIKVFKEGQEEIIEEQKNEEKNIENQNEKKQLIISMPIGNFILLQLGIIIIEVIICIIIVNKDKIFKTKKF